MDIYLFIYMAREREREKKNGEGVKLGVIKRQVNTNYNVER